MSTVKLQQIEKYYPDGHYATKKIDLEIKSNEFMVLVGPSGCGKSTLLRIIAGLEELSSGHIYIDDEKVNNRAPKDRNIAIVFQNYALYPHMSAYENMAFGLQQTKLSKAEIKQRISEVAELLEINEVLKKKPGELSGGQRQRIALGRAIVRKPKVFLFDEPLSNLDAKLRISTRMGISKLHKQLKELGEPATMIYVTHDQIEAMTLGDRICVLNKGEIMQVDTPINLYLHPKNRFVASFIGSPIMNFFTAFVSKTADEAILTININGLPEFSVFKAQYPNLIHYANLSILLGIRPEHIRYTMATKQPASKKIENIEVVGNEVFLYFEHNDTSPIANTLTHSTTTSSTTIIAREAFPLPIDVAIDDHVELILDANHLHFFDLENEVNISYLSFEQANTARIANTEANLCAG